jgi:hypothetical protein
MTELLTTNRDKALGGIVFCQGCCCGRTDRGRPELPVERLKAAWKADKLNQAVQLTISGCLGPCDVPNVAPDPRPRRRGLARPPGGRRELRRPDRMGAGLQGGPARCCRCRGGSRPIAYNGLQPGRRGRVTVTIGPAAMTGASLASTPLMKIAGGGSIRHTT